MLCGRRFYSIWALALEKRWQRVGGGAIKSHNSKFRLLLERLPAHCRIDCLMARFRCSLSATQGLKSTVGVYVCVCVCVVIVLADVRCRFEDAWPLRVECRCCLLAFRSGWISIRKIHHLSHHVLSVGSRQIWSHYTSARSAGTFRDTFRIHPSIHPYLAYIILTMTKGLFGSSWVVLSWAGSDAYYPQTCIRCKQFCGRLRRWLG
ncbi:hypothetical protein GGR50DRAFT_255466 [Xylaria sp. CBS 124048]|nr:hypothetical protein GGR50DRAFT_255466 [Xylaria sp. CBS 124048]